MNIFKTLKNRKKPMRRKLFLYMLALAVILLTLLACGLFFFGHFTTAKQTAENTLSFQMRTFDRQISKFFEDMTRMGNSLSESVAKKTDEFLAEEGLTIDDLNDDGERIHALQSALFDKLSLELLKTDCSGAFLMLNANVNTSVDGADTSKTGLYFQRLSLDESDERLSLYRGISQIAREKGVMPHRQWRLQFDTDEFPDYEKVTARSAKRSPFLTKISNLQGTSERTMNFVVPIFGNGNVSYGVCGFEISDNYFKKHFAQSTQLEHLTCMLFPKNGDVYDTESGFSAGVYGGY